MKKLDLSLLTDDQLIEIKSKEFWNNLPDWIMDYYDRKGSLYLDNLELQEEIRKRRDLKIDNILKYG